LPTIAASCGNQKDSTVNSQNAIIVRDTPDKIAIAEKLIKRH